MKLVLYRLKVPDYEPANAKYLSISTQVIMISKFSLVKHPYNHLNTKKMSTRISNRLTSTSVDH